MKKFASILIVDDDTVSNYITSRFLKRTGICDRISICRSGSEALRFIEKRGSNPPNLILVDIHLPLMSGVEFLQKLEKIPYDRSRSKVICYTINTKEVEAEMEKFGVEVLDKPLTIEKFFRVTGESSQMAI